MPKKEELQGLGFEEGQTYSRHVEGTPAILYSDIVTQDTLVVGDKIKMFSLPDGRTFISKVGLASEDAYTIGRVTAAHIYFDDEMTVKEI